MTPLLHRFDSTARSSAACRKPSWNMSRARSRRGPPSAKTMSACRSRRIDASSSASILRQRCRRDSHAVRDGQGRREALLRGGGQRHADSLRHEFAGDYRNWEPQMRFFARRHRCIAYSSRSYKPSDVPKDRKDYSYKHWSSDAIAVLDHLKIDKAHFVGLSMGGYTAIQIGLTIPGRALSIVPAGAGSGSERAHMEEFRKNAKAIDDEFLKQGHARGGEGLWPEPGAHFVPGEGPARLRGVQQDVLRARCAGLRQHHARLPGRAAVDLRFRGAASARSPCRR